MNSNLTAFLSLISWSEGTSTHPLTKNHGYDVIVTGDAAAGEVGLEVFTDYSDHPFAHRKPKLIRLPDKPANRSTASGRYQIIFHNYYFYRNSLHLPDFGAASQDAIATQLITERGALQHVNTGDIETAIKLCCTEWASFPGNDYGQAGGHTMQALLAQYQTLTA